MIVGARPVLLGLMLIAWAGTVSAYEFELRYYRIEDADVADDIEKLDREFESRGRPIKDRRRQAVYGTPEHARATAELEALQVERDRALARKVEGSKPEVEYAAVASEGQRVRDSGNLNGKPFNVEFTLRDREGDSLTLEVEADYDGANLYKGGALVVPLGSPCLVAKAFVKTEGGRRGSMVFIEVTP